MLLTHDKFHSAGTKRLVLVAEDEMINREILGSILNNDYKVIFAEDGREALEMIRANRRVLSLVLLDLMMPVMNGLELLRVIKDDPETERIPVIVMTSDQNSEIESLTLGAIDFISKPYPQAGVILARIRRTIELVEDRQIISSTERDPLTGLYNREYFYRYAEQLDKHHMDQDMDAIVVDVNHFHMINERFGTSYGDTVLRHVGEKMREAVAGTGGIVCRREADTFMIYCPSGLDYRAFLENASLELFEDGAPNGRVRLRMGVYGKVDKTLDIERRFDRAKLAADTVKGSFMKTIGIYDEHLHEKELYAEQLIDDFHRAIEEKQFKVYYQPKFDVRPEIPVLASAEALVRWQHPKLGLISPGVFIPLFEDNGMIQKLDEYVWRAAADQIRIWKERFGFAVPVSVNVSRIDMYDPHLVDTLSRIMEENGITPKEFLLEITESAYTKDSEQIIETVRRLRTLGFRIEMDDFGTGYSSLNMISRLPIDALKLDMQFVRNAFRVGGDTRMLEIIIDIADYLSVPVIAEGVETEEQLNTLRDMGCDIVQGYYFSKPVPADEYERFVEERKNRLEGGGEAAGQEYPASAGKTAARETGEDPDPLGSIAHALSSGFESIYYVDTATNHYLEFSSRGKYENLQIERSGDDFFGEMQLVVAHVVLPEDRGRVGDILRKETLLRQLDGDAPVSITYRVLVGPEPVYYNLKAVRALTHDDHHIVIGISNVDTPMRQAGTHEHPNEINFASLAQALTGDMESIYYVDIRTDDYMEFKTEGAYRKLALEISGKDFFGECRTNIPKAVYISDQEKVKLALEKDTLLKAIRDRSFFTMLYRLLIGGKPVYYRMKAVRTGGADENHLIIGVSNVDAQVTDADRLEAERRSTVTFASIAQALSQDYFGIYYVDTETDHFIEYSSRDEYVELGLEKSGENFFELSRKNVTRVMHPDDVSIFLEAFTKEKVLAAMAQNRSFTLTYRLIFDGKPTYVHMKITRMKDRDDPHIVVGVSNVDEQMRREEEHAKALRLANQDALTGVKSKHAYVDAERNINLTIADGRAEPFAVAVCDVNGLKVVNDTYGHEAGDQYLKAACRMICTIFKHSPVYRIGGDEFVAILRGDDYAIRNDLLEQLNQKNAENEKIGAVMVAGGISEFRAGEDGSLAHVFERADAAMYEAKKRMKGAR